MAKIKCSICGDLLKEDFFNNFWIVACSKPECR
jgi:hypothetical protein